MRHVPLVLAIAALAVLVLPLGAEVHSEWITEYDGPASLDDAACAIAADAQGNVYVTGKSEDGSARDDYATVKYAMDGTPVWAARYDGPGGRIDNARDIAVDAAGCVYVTGLCWSDATDYDYATVKYDPDGDEKWVAFYNGPGDSYDYPSAIAVDASGNVYVTGFAWGTGPDFDYVTIKYDPDGNEEWVATYDGPRNLGDVARDIVVDDAGYVYVTGQSEGVGTSSDFATIKYAPDGNEEWVARYDCPGHNADSGHAIDLDASGNVYVTGESWDPGSEDDIVTIVYDASGAEKWVSIYDGPLSDDDMPQAIAVGDAGDVRVTGMSRGASVNFDYVTIAYGAEGHEKWVSRYDGAGGGDDLAFALAMDDAGNVYVTGRSWGGVATCYDYATVKYNPKGGESWVATYDGAGNYFDEALDIALDGLGRVCVTGRSWGGEATGYDYITVVYSEGAATGVVEVAGSSVKLLPTHPNPFTSGTTVRFNAPERAGPVTLTVFDAGGRLVRRLIDGLVESGECHVFWDGTDERGSPVASGVYFVRLEIGGETSAEKTLLVR